MSKKVAGKVVGVALIIMAVVFVYVNLKLSNHNQLDKTKSQESVLLAQQSKETQPKNEAPEPVRKMDKEQSREEIAKYRNSNNYGKKVEPLTADQIKNFMQKKPQPTPEKQN